MSAVALFETLVSVSVQVAVLLLAAEWLHRRTQNPVVHDRLHARAYQLILLLTGAGLLLPHLRLTVLPALTPLQFQREMVHGISRLSSVLVPVWLAGCGIHLMRVVFGLWRGSGLIHRATLLPDDRTHDLHQRLEAAGFPAPQPQLRVSPLVSSPLLWHFHRPVIVLPETMLHFPVEEVELVLRHEAAHLAARHPVELFLQRVVESVFWFHPSVRRASRRSSASREILCDQAAVHTSAEAGTYLRTIIRLVESRNSTAKTSTPKGTLPVGVDLLSDESLLRERTRALLRRLEAPAAPNVIPPAPAVSSTKLLTAATICCGLLLWLPLNPLASLRSVWSPWPAWSARTLDVIGMHVRDYEIDAHRLTPHRHLH
ncbi:MAG: M56 family metallopeptidase [Planctomycetaceae bacterium]|nr:M56 family metallopeptidase [Planctomycetaceae bacterium]